MGRNFIQSKNSSLSRSEDRCPCVYSFFLNPVIFNIFRTFGDYTATLTDGANVDLYIGWVWDNNAFGTTGIAYLGTVCDGAKYRTSLNEYFMTDLQTAQVLIYKCL